MTFPSQANRKLLILGTRGVPAAHGGFETFAERLSLYLVKRGWNVTVYCQAEGTEPKAERIAVDNWNGVRRVIVNVRSHGAKATVEFDWACVKHAALEDGLPLVLGYNTAVFLPAISKKGRPIIVNMDGIEWKRAKWGLFAKAWLYVNERVGLQYATVAIADHPAISEHLRTRNGAKRIETIAYGADCITDAPTDFVRSLNVVPGNYYLSVGRIEPENSILEMISAFSERQRDTSFVCVGKLDPENNKYHAAVRAAANQRVIFPGAVYDKENLQALRFHALAYCHGHTVGGTNPSLVEALGAGNAVIAHDNRFNRWVAGDGQKYFRDAQSCAEIMRLLEADPAISRDCQAKARIRFNEGFAWEHILGAYEQLLEEMLHAQSLGAPSLV